MAIRWTGVQYFVKRLAFQRSTIGFNSITSVCSIIKLDHDDVDILFLRFLEKKK